MAVVKGGSKTNLVEHYAAGEDTNVDYGKARWISQTFTLDEETVVWRFRLKSWTIEGAHFYHYDLHATDGAGKPTGAPIAQTTLSPTGEYWYAPGKWRRFDFPGFPKLPAGLYAIVASVPDAAHFINFKLRAHDAASTYVRGKCWRSHNSGVDWEELTGTDLMFEVWGYQTPPEPPPEPVISNWAPEQLSYFDTGDGYKVTFVTDNLCHLFMRWTLIPPQQHIIPRYRRGVWLFDDKRFCFVAYHENEQLEAGDTYVHTFIKNGWPVCQTRWFYFVGTKQAEQQPSTSPIFTKHRYYVPPPAPTSDCQPDHEHNWGFCQNWNAGSQTFTPDHSYTLRRISVMLNQFVTARRGPYVLKLTIVDGSPFEEELLWAEVGQSEELPLPGVAEWVHFDDVSVDVAEGVTYRIVVHTIPGWLFWNGTEWESWEIGAAMRWWYAEETPYDRGWAWYGANFRDEAGIWWKLGADNDFTFCCCA